MVERKFDNRITIKDIAVEVNVSTATVSKALRGKEGVSEETLEKVLESAQRLNYYPNLQARTLVGQKPNGIGIIIPQTSEFAFSNPYYAEIIKGIAAKTRESDQHLLFYFAEEESYAQMFFQRLVSGIIVMANRLNDPWIAEAWKKKVPMVLIPGCVSPERIPSVDINNVEAGFLAVNYLIKIGHRRIGFVNGHGNSKYSIGRLEGFKKAFEINKLPLNRELILDLDFTQERAYEGMKKLVCLIKPPTAVLVITDYCALGALKGAKDMNLRVPEDISIVSFGDVPFASMLDPRLTTIRQPFREIGYEAVNMLLKIIDGKRLHNRNLLLPVELVVRESSSPPKQKE